MLSPTLRKAAVLISALDEDAAETLLRQMGDEQAAKVRSALVELDDIAAEEQQQVLAEFFKHQGGASANAATDDVELDIDPRLEAAIAREMPPPAVAPLEPVDHASFDFLEHVSPQAIAALLCKEHPQTAAVVISQLPPQGAAAVLQRLPAALATEALERIAWLDELAPEVLADLARELRRQLAPHLSSSTAGQAGLTHLSAVLQAMDYSQRQRLLLQLADRNANLLERLGVFPSSQSPPPKREVISLRYRLDSNAPLQKAKPTVARASEPNSTSAAWLSFQDLSLLDDAALRQIFAAADPEIVLLALTGADARFVARVLRKLPTREAALVRERLEHPGPLRIREVEQAQSALAAIASRLAHEGAIALPSTAHFAAAV